MMDFDRVQRLRRAIEFSREKLEPFRQRRMAALREFVGRHYSDEGMTAPTPVNLLELATGIYLRQLVARNPRVMVETRYRQLRPACRLFEMGINHLLGEIDFDATLRALLMEAMFSVGILKLGMNQSRTVEIGGFLHDIGQPFADVVTLDDFIVDMNAKRWEEVSFIGNRYRMPLEDAQACGLFDPKVMEKLSPTSLSRLNEGGDERAESLGVGADGDPEEYLDHVELADIYLPRENLMLTLAWDQESLDPLRIEPWNGPECGPYLKISFTDVPGNLLPLPPVAAWMDLHLIANTIYRKLTDQADRQKDITIAGPGAEEDARAVASAPDGETVRVNHPERIRKESFGGVDQQSLVFGMHILDRASYQFGNLDLLGGLSPQSPTLGQDQLLAESASVRLADMQAQVYRFTKTAVGALGWFLWYEPMIELPMTFRLDILGIEIPAIFDETAREGDFLDYNIEIEPYSMQSETPARRLGKVMDVVNGILAPFAPYMAEQGMTPNFEGILRAVARYSNLPEIEELVVFAQPHSPAPGPVGGQASPRPPITTRRYERINRSGNTRAGRDAAMMQALAGGGLQPSQAARIGRPLG